MIRKLWPSEHNRAHNSTAFTKRLVVTSLLFIVGLLSSLFDWNVQGVHVIVVEPTYIPRSVSFQIDTAAGACPAGTWLSWPAQGSDPQSQEANVAAVYATLLAAKVTGKTINLYGMNAGCIGKFLHMQ